MGANRFSRRPSCLLCSASDVSVFVHVCTRISACDGPMNEGTHTGSRAPRLPPDLLCCTRSACTSGGEKRRVAESADCAGEINALNYKNLNVATDAASDKSPTNPGRAAGALNPTAEPGKSSSSISIIQHLR